MCFVTDISGIYPANGPTSTPQFVVPNYDPSHSNAAVFSMIYNYNGTGAQYPTGQAFIFMSANATTIPISAPKYTYKPTGFMFICFALGLAPAGMGY